MSGNEQLHLNKLLYGIWDAGDYLRITLKEHIINDLGMNPIVSNPTLCTKYEDKKLIGLCESYVEDSIHAGTPNIGRVCELMLQKYESKLRLYD